MKGFPNQTADFSTLSRALSLIQILLEEGENPKDDKTYGMRLIREGILGTGHTPIPIEEYLQGQLIKKPSNRSFQTRARGLRELFGILGLIRVIGDNVKMTSNGETIASFAHSEITGQQLDKWRSVITNMSHIGGDGEASHPYQVLLRLIKRSPGISRAKCALALEAANDTEEELNRILLLAEKDENEIISTIGATKSNWDNAKKILPKFAEQLGDVIKRDGCFYLNELTTVDSSGGEDAQQVRTGTRMKSRRVSSGNIGSAGTGDDFDEVEIPSRDDLDTNAMAQAIRTRKRRLQVHNEIVRQIATLYENKGASLYEHPFDCLAVVDNCGYLVEVKTLDGTSADEVKQVRGSLAQLLYYESFALNPDWCVGSVTKIACFESKPNDEHVVWLNSFGVQVIWKQDEMFVNLSL